MSELNHFSVVNHTDKMKKRNADEVKEFQQRISEDEALRVLITCDRQCED